MEAETTTDPNILEGKLQEKCLQSFKCIQIFWDPKHVHEIKKAFYSDIILCIILPLFSLSLQYTLHVVQLDDRTRSTEINLIFQNINSFFENANWTKMGAIFSPSLRSILSADFCRFETFSNFF